MVNTYSNRHSKHYMLFSLAYVDMNCLFLQAFGMMGILFLLVIPTVCELESADGGQCRMDIIIQVAAAIMGSSI